MRLKVRLSALVAQLQLIVRLSGPSSSSTEKEAHEGIRAGERHSMCSSSIWGRCRPYTKAFDELGRTRTGGPQTFPICAADLHRAREASRV